MTRPNSIQEAFYPLNRRLLSFEDYEFLADLEEMTDGTSVSMMRMVYLDASLFEDEVVFKYSTKYIDRLKAIYISLDAKINEQEKDDSWKENILKQFYIELGDYYYYLEKLQNETGNKDHLSLSESKSREYVLHEKFDLLKVKREAGFTGKLSAINVATLFYYLFKTGFSPYYSTATRARIGHALFWVNPKNISENFAGSQPAVLNKESTAELIEKLNELIDFINSDIASGFKK